MSRETKEESGIAKGARRATEAGPDSSFVSLDIS